MIWLLIVSVVWAFSFGLIKGRLVGVDTALVALVRVALALLVFAPMLRPRAVSAREASMLCGIGAVQFGLMYVCYNAAFASLAAYEVAALTIFTPVLVALFDAAMRRHVSGATLGAAGLAVLGAGIIVINRPLSAKDWTGILWVQGSNLCFAAGQVAWRHWRLARPWVNDGEVFGWLYAGAVLACMPFSLSALGGVAKLTTSQMLTLAYLGIIASGVCFFLWNRGVRQSSTAFLAVANNLKIPLSVVVSIAVFGERGEPKRLALGILAILAATGLAQRKN